MFRNLVSLSFPVLVGAVPTVAAAQSPIPLRDGCNACRIEVTRGVALGDEGNGHLGFVNSAVRNARGEFLIATRARPSEILVFSPRGDFLRTIGRQGSGPAEFQWIATLIISTNDSLHVFDLAAHRWSVLSPSYQIVRTAQYSGEYNHSATILKGGVAVLNLFLGTRSSAGYPLHALGPNGQVVRSFGSMGNAPVRYDVPSSWARVVGRASDSTLWAANLNEYRLTLWHVNGVKLAEFLRSPTPFEPWIQSQSQTRREPPRPIMKAVYVDAAGLLWILYHVPDQRWRNAMEETQTSEGTFYTGDRDALLDTVIEAIDPARRIVLGTQRLNEVLDGFAADGFAYGFNEAQAKLQLWNVRVINR